MITIRNIEELEDERVRQRKAWIKSGGIAWHFFLNLMGANLKGADLRGADLRRAWLIGVDLRGADLTGANFKQAKIKNTIITQSQYDELAKLYSHKFMAGFIVKDMEVCE